MNTLNNNDWSNIVWVVGIGCRNGCRAEEIIDLIKICTEECAIALADIAALVSIDDKADEPGLVAAAERLDRPLVTWPAATLARFEECVTQPSAAARSRFGVAGIAETAALTGIANAGSGIDVALVLPRRATARAVAAVARHTVRRVK